MNWTDQEIEILRRMWSEGSSYLVIGRALQRTRNAVAGKVHKLNLEKRGKSKSMNSKIALPEKEPAIPEKVTLFDLKDGMCKYPFGEEDVLFCGAPVSSGSYCKEHADLCYQRAPRVNVTG